MRGDRWHCSTNKRGSSSSRWMEDGWMDGLMDGRGLDEWMD